MNNIEGLIKQSHEVSKASELLLLKTTEITNNLQEMANNICANPIAVSPIVFQITIFVLACIIGYHIVWRVTPALHTPLMSITNAISGIVIIGGMIAAGAGKSGLQFSNIIGLLSVILASINIFGGFFVTYKMLSMFRKK